MMSSVYRAPEKVPAEITDQLLRDLRVQAAIQRAGQYALDDAEVQREIVNACREKSPEVLANLTEEIDTWSRDPLMHEKVADVLRSTAVLLSSPHLTRQIEQGPALIRACALCGMLSTITLSIASTLNTTAAIDRPVLFVVSIYQLFFATCAVLFELNPAWLMTAEDSIGLPVSSAQDYLLDHAKGLSLSGGRGLLYTFQGSLWLSFASFPITGVSLVAIGIVHMLMHVGVVSKDPATKIRQGYHRLGSAYNL